ncbi:hypothetical protein EG68_00219 [Paragonimus skrjabini miyazakii]|uniref:Uncharacterized protein n=1 Tax=Paragonimus skrjabini miyazakii TaxID=59628 RepID=A0A8S9ZCI0_9TREM|nr:hypothetical protein EG68_00219 [Paragonimus skrjabini miyazakii]
MREVALFPKSTIFKGGLRFTKFCSNEYEALSRMSVTSLIAATVDLDWQQTEAQKAPGFVWVRKLMTRFRKGPVRLDDNLPDASEAGYEAAVYARPVDTGRSIYCSLVFEKPKVTSMRAASIPRMEQTTFVLPSKLVNRLIDVLLREAKSVLFWSD